MNNALFLSCFIFLLFLILLPAHPQPMLADPDTWWHLAAGDWIRTHGAIPEHDPWSFTAGSERWLNISWGWDVMLSYVFQHGGWDGAIIFNSILIAAMLALIFAACFLRTQHTMASFLVTALIAAAMLNATIRPHQVSFLFIAALNLLLLQVTHKKWPMHWLMIVPPLMIIWVNCHGEFLTAFFFLGIYALNALMEKNGPLVKWLIATGVLSLAACLINPYGIFIVEGTLRTIASASKPFIMEWNALDFSSYYRAAQLYLAFFVILVMMRQPTGPRSERWVAYIWLVLALLSVRHLNAFAIVSAPLLAVGLRDDMLRHKPAPLTPIDYDRTKIIAALLAVIAMPVVMFSLYKENIVAPPDLSAEIAFIEHHVPKAKLLNNYELGGPLMVQSQGKIPIFIDGRAGTAYPEQVLQDYVTFLSADKNWTAILDHYSIDGVIITNTEQAILDRFTSRRGWHLAFTGKTASIFLRDKS